MDSDADTVFHGAHAHLFIESALIYGIAYSLLAVTANKIGSLFHSKTHSINSRPRES